MKRPVQLQESVLKTDAGTFVPIRLASLLVDSVTDFNLYVLPSAKEHPVLYREKAVPFAETDRTRLRDNEVDVLYIEASQEDEYWQYVERNLGRLLKDEAFDVREKSSLAYSATQGIVAQVLDSPRSPQTIVRAQELVLTLVEFVLEERAALESLIDVMSFDYYTYTHSVNVFVFSVTLAQRTGVGDPRALRELGDGALLHDVGKTELDPGLINFPGTYSPEQFENMKLHSVFGHDLLKKHGLLSERALDVVRHHHEKLGGGGYPDGLDGDEISSFVRICTIADVFDALTTQRSYKDALPSFPALKLMQEEMSAGLDEGLFRAFVEMMGNPGSAQ